MLFCQACGEFYELPAKGSLFVDDPTGISYRVTDHWLHVGRLTAHVAVLQPQHPSGGGHLSTVFSTQLPESARVVWAPWCESAGACPAVLYGGAPVQHRHP